jgi:hypothetical protein
MDSSNQSSKLLFSARNDSALLPLLRGVNWALAAVNDSTKETKKLEGSSLHAAVESSSARIARGTARASNFGKTVRALEEGDRVREGNATRPQAYPYELWEGVGVELVFAGGCAFFYRVGGRKNVAGKIARSKQH